MLDRINEDLSQLCGENSLFTKFREGHINNDGWLDLAKIWKSSIVDGKGLEYKDRVMLYAFTRLSQLLPNLGPTDVNQWARLVRNLVENKRFNESGDAVKAIADIDAMLSDLVSWLQQNPSLNINVWTSQQLDQIKFRAFDQSQKEEEIVKATLRQISGWEQELDDADKHFYLSGNIRLILYYANLIPVKGPFKLVTDEYDLALFQSYREKCMRLFDQAGNADSKTTKEKLLVRALFSLGDYTKELKNCKRNIYNQPSHRDYSWSALFRLDVESNINAVGYLKDILDNKVFLSSIVENSLENIISQTRVKSSPLWVRMLSSEYGQHILEKSREGFLCIPEGNPENALIFTSKQRNGYNCPIYILYLEKLIRDLKPTIDVYSSWAKGENSDYSIVINGAIISYWNSEWYIGEYSIRTGIATTVKDLASYIRQLL